MQNNLKISLWQYLRTDAFAVLFVTAFSVVPGLFTLMMLAQEPQMEASDLRALLTFSGGLFIFGTLLVLLAFAAHVGAVNRSMAGGQVVRSTAQEVQRNGPLTIIVPDGSGLFDRLPSVLISNGNLDQIQAGMPLTFPRLGALRIPFPNRVPLEAFFHPETIRVSLNSSLKPSS